MNRWKCLVLKTGVRIVNIVSEKELMNCRCGGKARYRYRIPVHWIECRNKRCECRTRYYPDSEGTNCDPEARARAVDEWNRMVSE